MVRKLPGLMHGLMYIHLLPLPDLLGLANQNLNLFQILKKARGRKKYASRAAFFQLWSSSTYFAARDSS